MKPLCVAVIGAGHLGRIHTRLLANNPSVELVGVVDSDPHQCRQITDEFGLQTFDEYRKLCSSIDGVIIAAPTQIHYDIAIDCLNRGIHTFIEKPITINVRQADHLIHTADQQQLVLQVGHVERFNPAFEQAQDLLPTPRYFEANRMSTFTMRSTDVGVVHDLMIHDIDLLASLVPSPLLETRAVGVAVFGPHEDIAQARLEFADGTIANLRASRCSFEPQRKVSWFGLEGFVSADLTSGTVQSIIAPQILDSSSRDISHLGPEQHLQIKESLFEEVLPLQKTTVASRNAIEMEHADFLTAIKTTGLPRVTGRHGRRAVSIAESIVESIKAHRWQDGTSTRAGHQAARINLLPTNNPDQNQRRAG